MSRGELVISEMILQIDAEVRQVIGKAYRRALEVMTTHRDILDNLAQQLIQKEALNEEEVNALLASATS